MKHMMHRFICILMLLLSMGLWWFWKNEESRASLELSDIENLMQEKEKEILEFRLYEPPRISDKVSLSSQDKLDVVATDLNTLRNFFKDKNTEGLNIDLAGHEDTHFTYFRYHITFSLEFTALLPVLESLKQHTLSPHYVLQNCKISGNAPKTDVFLEVIHVRWPPVDYGDGETPS